jgi:uncharacterized integral membrane protein
LLRRLVAAIILVPLAIVLIAFAVANRHEVTVSFDPFAGSEPAASLTLPLFVLIVLLLVVGVLIGGSATWLRHHRWRGTARRFERELQSLRGRLAAFEGTAAQAADARDKTSPPPRLKLQPPAR